MNTTLSASSPALAPHPHDGTQYAVGVSPVSYGQWVFNVYLPKSTSLPLGQMTHKGWGAKFLHVLPDSIPVVTGARCASKEEALAAGHKFLAAILADEVGGFVDGWVRVYSVRC